QNAIPTSMMRAGVKASGTSPPLLDDGPYVRIRPPSIVVTYEREQARASCLAPHRMLQHTAGPRCAEVGPGNLFAIDKFRNGRLSQSFTFNASTRAVPVLWRCAEAMR